MTRRSRRSLAAVAGGFFASSAVMLASAGVAAAIVSVPLQDPGFDDASWSNGFGFDAVCANNQGVIGSQNGLPGWHIDASCLNPVNDTYWQPHNGTVSLDMSGGASDLGQISQVLQTTPGQVYEVTFWLAGNVDGAPSIKTLFAGVDGAFDNTFTFDDTGKTKTNMGWTQKVFDFTATGTSTTLAFLSGTVNYGPVIDDISITTSDPVVGAPVIDPMIAGLSALVLGAAGFVVVRRRKLSTV